MLKQDFLPPVQIKISPRNANFALRSCAVELIQERFSLDKPVENAAAQMGRVQTSENAVPICVVALPCQKLGLSIGEQARGLRVVRRVAARLLPAAADFEHQFMNVIRLRIFAKEIFPEPPPKQTPEMLTGRPSF